MTRTTRRHGHRWAGNTLSTLWIASPDQASEIKERAYSLVSEAVQLDPESATAQSSLGMVRTARVDWIGGEQGLTRAIELLADRTTVGRYGDVLLRNGRSAEAQKQYAIAAALEPTGGASGQFVLAREPDSRADCRGKRRRQLAAHI